MILVPGLGFDARVFEDFMKANENEFTMYAITIPGFGTTHAPPMPDTSVSYGEQTWNKGIIEGLLRLIEKEHLHKPVIAGHFVLGAQVALRMAIEHPGQTGALIILGGPARFIVMQQGKLAVPPLQKIIEYTDKVTSKTWFLHMRKEFFDAGNFVKEIYSLDKKTGEQLWNEAASVPLPVAVRYSCEYFASDLLSAVKEIQCPVLVLRAGLTDSLTATASFKNWIGPQLFDSWDIAIKENPSIQVKNIGGSGTFVWKDQPAETYSAIKTFTAALQ